MLLVNPKDKRRQFCNIHENHAPCVIDVMIFFYLATEELTNLMTLLSYIIKDTPHLSPIRLQLLPANALITWTRVNPESGPTKLQYLSIKTTLTQYNTKSKSLDRALYPFAHLIAMRYVAQVQPPPPLYCQVMTAPSFRCSKTGSCSSVQRDFRRLRPRPARCGAPGGCGSGI